MPLPLAVFASVKSRLVLHLLYRPTRMVPDKWPLNCCQFVGCVDIRCSLLVIACRLWMLLSYSASAENVVWQVWQYSGVQSVMWALRWLCFVATLRRRSAARCRSAWVRVCQRWTSFSASLTPFCRALYWPSRIAAKPTLALPPLLSATLSHTSSVSRSSLVLYVCQSFMFLVTVAVLLCVETFPLLLLQFWILCKRLKYIRQYRDDIYNTSADGFSADLQQTTAAFWIKYRFLESLFSSRKWLKKMENWLTQIHPESLR